LRGKLEMAFQEIALKDKGPVQLHTDQAGLLYSNVCKMVETVYRHLEDSSEWPLAKHAQHSSKARPAQYPSVWHAEKWFCLWWSQGRHVQPL
jgi:hypothetical protein